MICYRDRSWCSHSCGNLECGRNFTEEESIRANKWWEMFNSPDSGPPIAVMDFRTEDCGYKEPDNEPT